MPTLAAAPATFLVQLKPHGRNQTESAVIGSDGVGIAGDTFDSKLVRHLVAPMLGMGSEYRTPFGKVLPMPLWVYENLQRWHYLSFLKTRKNMRTLNQLRFHALEPQKIAALIEIVDHDLGYRLYQAIEGTKCNLSSAPASAFVFKELSTGIDESVTQSQFENWINRKFGTSIAASIACLPAAMSRHPTSAPFS